MKPKQILTDLLQLEGQLYNFSYEELTMEEAAQLKKSFMFFKNRLEEKIHGVKLAETAQIGEVGIVDSHEDQTSTANDPPIIKNESLLAKLHDELRTPVNELLGLADRIMEEGMDLEQHSKIGTVRSITNNLSGILNELQEYIALATGKEKFENIDFNLSHIIKDILFLCKALIVHKEVRLTIDMDKGVPTFLIGDPSKLSQILLYLLGNTIKYINTGTIHLHIGLRKDLGDTCCVQFNIGHPGMGKTHKGLERFYNALTGSGSPNREKVSEMGLGMDIIKQLIKNLNGNIPTVHALARDTTFSFYLPYVKGVGIKQGNNKISSSKKSHLEKIWRECSGEVDLLEEMIGLFKTNILEFIGKLKIYLPLGEFEKIHAAAHKVRTSADLMRADCLLPIIDALLANCSTVRDIHYLNILYGQFLSAYPSLERAIDTELELLRNEGTL